MAEDRIRLTIEGQAVEVPTGALIVDAAKQAGIDVPVFCYHPKLDPVGMCRMCLVEVGRPGRDRASGEPLLDESGQPVIQYGPNLETACTTPVGEGWVVRVGSAKAVQGREQILEHLLTSHPLDCPVCDKGGECPLQNLTMQHGPGVSRFLFDDKIRLAKRVPLGELIWLDRERCIQCARCTRFQTEIVADPVIGFYQRGRRLEIVTYSDPGFDSYFSGNTTDICPVGALTTADFRFGARPWELNSSASICPHCPVGCNLSLNTRREALSGGGTVIKRILPRQNEAVNEIWICDKGRFAHHFAQSAQRLARPLVRQDGKLKPASWTAALKAAAEGLRQAGKETIGLAGGRLSNEDLFNFRQAIEGMGGQAFLHGSMAGGDLLPRVGLGQGSNLGSLGPGDAVLVLASDLHEEAPIWWLRIKQAAERGATLIVANARPTRLDDFAAHQVRYPYGEAYAVALGLLGAANGEARLKRFAKQAAVSRAGKAFAKAKHAVLFLGQEGVGRAQSAALASACARLLADTGHGGGPNNGLVMVWPAANTQGAWDMGLRPPDDDLAATVKAAKAAWVAGADPAGDDPAAAALGELDFLVVQELALTPTAELADVVLPAQSFVEREGTYTSGERRVQRFYPAVPPHGDSLPDWQICARLGLELELPLENRAVALVFDQIAAAIRDYSAIDYRKLAEVKPQWPEVGGQDLYFGGTSYRNSQGLGCQLPSSGELEAVRLELPPASRPAAGTTLVPITRLYDRGSTLAPSKLLKERVAALAVSLNPEDARALGIVGTGKVRLSWDGRVEELPVICAEGVPHGAALIPRSMGFPLSEPITVTLDRAD